MARRLHMYQLALDLVDAVRPLHEQLRKRDREQARQLKDATNSVPNNIAEGARREGRDRTQHWLIAAGSADEVRSDIETSVRWGDLDREAVTPALAVVDRILAMLWRATHPR